MEKKEIELVMAKLLEINELVLQLDPSIRAAAFEVLRARYFGGKLTKPPKGNGDEPAVHSSDDALPAGELGTFISSYEHKKPAENVMLLAAWLYSTYGVYAITVKEIRELGGSCGLIVPVNRTTR